MVIMIVINFLILIAWIVHMYENVLVYRKYKLKVIVYQEWGQDGSSGWKFILYVSLNFLEVND